MISLVNLFRPHLKRWGPSFYSEASALMSNLLFYIAYWKIAQGLTSSSHKVHRGITNMVYDR